MCQQDPQHGQDPRCGGETLYIERVLLRSRSVGHPTGCWRQLVDAWSALLSTASSGQASLPLSCRFSWLGEAVRAQHGAAGVVLGGCDGWDVRTHLHASFER
jgi:hypothetical protein